MAEAKVITVPPSPPPEKRVLLELTMEEAGALRSLLGWAVLGPNTSRRRLTDEIYDALKKAGAKSDRSDLRGSVEFLGVASLSHP